MLSDKEIIIAVVVAVLSTTVFFGLLRFLFIKWIENFSKDILDLKEYVDAVNAKSCEHIKVTGIKFDKTHELCRIRGEKIGEIEGTLKK